MVVHIADSVLGLEIGNVIRWGERITPKFPAIITHRITRDLEGVRWPTVDQNVPPFVESSIE